MSPYHHVKDKAALAELVTAHAEDRGYSCADEFAYGLDLILDSVEVRLREVGG